MIFGSLISFNGVKSVTQHEKSRKLSICLNFSFFVVCHYFLSLLNSSCNPMLHVSLCRIPRTPTTQCSHIMRHMKYHMKNLLTDIQTRIKFDVNWYTPTYKILPDIVAQQHRRHWNDSITYLFYFTKSDCMWAKCAECRAPEPYVCTFWMPILSFVHDLKCCGRVKPIELLCRYTHTNTLPHWIFHTFSSTPRNTLYAIAILLICFIYAFVRNDKNDRKICWNIRGNGINTALTW